MDTDFWYCSDVSSIDLSNLIAFPPLFLQTHQIRCNSEVTVKAFFAPDAVDSGLCLAFAIHLIHIHRSCRLLSNQPFDSPGMKTYDCSIRPILELHSLLTFKEISFQDVEATFLQQKTKTMTVMLTYESSLYFYSIFLHQ